MLDFDWIMTIERTSRASANVFFPKHKQNYMLLLNLLCNMYAVKYVSMKLVVVCFAASCRRLCTRVQRQQKHASEKLLCHRSSLGKLTFRFSIPIKRN